MKKPSNDEKEMFLLLKGWRYYVLPFDDFGNPNPTKMWLAPLVRRKSLGLVPIPTPMFLDEAYEKEISF